MAKFDTMTQTVCGAHTSHNCYMGESAKIGLAFRPQLPLTRSRLGIELRI